MFRLTPSHHFFQQIPIYVYIFGSGQCRKVHVIAHLAVLSSSTLGWRPIAWRQARDGSQEGDSTAWGTETLLGLPGLLKQWVESGLNPHLKIKILMNTNINIK